MKWARIFLCIGFLASLAPVSSYASLNVCDVTYSPTSVSPGRLSNFAFDVHNGSPKTMAGVQIVPPDGSGLEVTAADARHWTADTGGGVSATFTDWTLGPGANQVFNVQGSVGPDEGEMGDWSVMLFDNNDGSITCTGDLGLTVAAQPSDIAISNVAVINIGQTAATMTWNTNLPANSRVVYGADSSYGKQSTLNSTLALDHSVTITGLTANTPYHFAVVSGTQQAGDSVTSGDNTFLTLAPVVVNTGAGANGAAPRGTIAISASPDEMVPPTVVVTTSLARPFTKDPVVAGAAADNVAVARIDYSLNGGKSWVVVPNPSGLGTKAVNFSFTAAGLEDANYSLVVRATDTSGNSAATAPATLVVDQQPPRIGAELVSYGPQPAMLDAAGRWRAAVGTDETITLNAVGGPVRMAIVATRAGSTRAGHSFYLRQDPDSGLWSGLLAFGTAGIYHLSGVAVDGAGNQTSRVLPDAVVSPSARVVAANGRPVKDAKVTLYYRQRSSGQWLAWDGAPYGEANPQTVGPAGEFALLAPAGEYYLKVEAAGYETLVTQGFKAVQSMPIVPTLKLVSAPKLQLGPWSWTVPWVTLSQTQVDPSGGYSEAAAGAGALVGHNLPPFRLPKTDGTVATAVSLQGKPTVVTVLSTWAPSAAEQLPALAKVARTYSGVNVVPLYLGERAGKVEAALARGGYDLPAIVDSKAILGDQLGVPNVPTQYFVDRTGKVVSVHVGVMPEAELLSRLLNSGL